MKKEAKRNKMKLPKHLKFTWLHGWINGRTGTAAAINGVVQSGYLQQLSNRYAAYAAGEVSGLDRRLHEYSAEAERILQDYHREEYPAEPAEPLPTEGLSILEQQLARAAEARRASERARQSAQQKAAADALIGLAHDIEAAEEHCQTALLQTANRLEEVFAAYGKGVLWRRPLRPDAVPTVDIHTQAYELHRARGAAEKILQRIWEVTA